jgi:hypothetical protein
MSAQRREQKSPDGMGRRSMSGWGCPRNPSAAHTAFGQMLQMRVFNDASVSEDSV